jgi:rRNA maturation protein Nop10
MPCEAVVCGSYFLQQLCHKDGYDVKVQLYVS